MKDRAPEEAHPKRQFMNDETTTKTLPHTLGQRRVVVMEGGRAVIEYMVGMHMCHSGGVVQGGFATGWIDAAMAHAVMSLIGRETVPMTLEMKVSFFAPARPGLVIAEAWVEKQGKSVCFAEGLLKDDKGDALAKASSTIRLVPMANVEVAARAALKGWFRRRVEHVVLQIDPALISPVAALLGALVGGGASLIAAIYTQRVQDRLQRVAAEIAKREAVYADFVMSASQLILNAHVRDDIALGGDEQRLVGLINRMGLFASPEVLGGAEAVLKTFVDVLLRLRRGQATRHGSACRRPLARPFTAAQSRLQGRLGQRTQIDGVNNRTPPTKRNEWEFANVIYINRLAGPTLLDDAPAFLRQDKMHNERVIQDLADFINRVILVERPDVIWNQLKDFASKLGMFYLAVFATRRLTAKFAPGILYIDAPRQLVEALDREWPPSRNPLLRYRDDFEALHDVRTEGRVSGRLRLARFCPGWGAWGRRPRGADCER